MTRRWRRSADKDKGVCVWTQLEYRRAPVWEVGCLDGPGFHTTFSGVCPHCNKTTVLADPDRFWDDVVERALEQLTEE